MRQLRSIAAGVAALAATVLPATAQTAKGQPQPAGVQPYKAVRIVPPKPLNDPAFEAFRKQLSEAAQKRDRAALTRLVAPTGFFWERENRNAADKRRSGLDNLSAALGLASKDSAGWDMLAGFADDVTASEPPGHKGVLCAPADPAYNRKEFDALLKATHSDPSQWGYPVSAGLAVHATPQASAPVVEKLELTFVRVMPDGKPVPAAYLRIVTPSGKAGYVTADSIAPIGNDQVCYAKDGADWKIGGYIGGGEPQ